MNLECNTRQGYNNCQCHINNSALILSAVIALLLVNCINPSCIGALAAILQSVGELMEVGITSRCCL